LRSRILIATLLLATACEIETVAIQSTDARVALHGVLSATASEQFVLLERTRSGSAASFDLAGTLVSEGLAETDAIVELTLPNGQTLAAVEDKARPETMGQGGGIYRFALQGAALQRNATYQLSVRTTAGELLSASTSVPGGPEAQAAEPRRFDRARDTMTIMWPAAPGARSYLVRIETPYGPRSFFTDSTWVRLAGSLRNSDVVSLPRVFIPGFPQAVTISAVDSNYYDWYRTHNEQLSGTGLINRVNGGMGVFGSLVRLRFLDVRVVAPQPDPPAGMFQFVGTPLERSTTRHLGLELYVESRAARADQADQLSGRYDRRPFLGMIGCVTCGLLGTVRERRIELVFLEAWSARDTVEVFTGEIRGDTIIGAYRNFGGVARFVRQP
jgi:hypothetical protein